MDRNKKSSDEKFFIPAKKVRANSNNCIAINFEGDLYGWGNNQLDKLGLKTEVELTEYFLKPILFNSFKSQQLKLVDIDIGEDHVLAVVKRKDGLNEDIGEIYSWGLNLSGRLGYFTDLSTNHDDDIPSAEIYQFKRVPYALKFKEKIARVACGTDFSACISASGKLYTWGNNKWGNLGITDEQLQFGISTRSKISVPTLVTALKDEKIIQVVCGDRHMMALTRDRRVYSWGNGAEGQLGHGNDESISIPQTIMALQADDLIFIAAGPYTSAAINSKGQLYTWGNGQFGKLGLGTTENALFPSKVMENSIITDRVFYVALGYYHSVGCTLEGRTFAMGYSFRGRLGSIPEEECENKESIALPRLISTLEGVLMIQLIVGPFHSMAVSMKGKIYGWGENKNFIMGKITDESESKEKAEVLYFPRELLLNKILGKTANDVENVFKTFFLSSKNLQQNYNISKKFKIKKIACGGTHTLALTSSGDVLIWGYGKQGQLGQGDQIDCLPNPTLVNFRSDAKMSKIYAGLYHSMTITTVTYQVYTWGEGERGQLGFKKKTAYEPTLIETLIGKEVIKGSLGCDNSTAVTKGGEVYVWGSNTNNKLGLETKGVMETFPVLNTYLKNIKSISLGAEHSGAINSKGELFCWGNGFFGQLGLNDSNGREIPTKLKSAIIWKKIKCGSFQTLAMSNDNQVYLCGKGKLNLCVDENKHKSSFEAIDDFKGNNKAKAIVAGYGNSLVLTYKDIVYGFGDNKYYKAGGETGGETGFVDKNVRIISFGQKGVQNVSIEKIFAGYDSCFAISSIGEIFAWGCPRLFRLTHCFGEDICKVPKSIQIEWQHKGVKDGRGNEELGEIQEEEEAGTGDRINDTNLDERQLRTILNKNMRITTFKEIFSFIKKIGDKYADHEIIKKDMRILQDTTMLLNKIPQEFEASLGKLCELFMEIDQLTAYRTKDIHPPIIQGSQLKANLHMEVIKNFEEIEKIYSLFFIHPCLMKQILDIAKYEEYSIFFEGIKPLYRGIGSIGSKETENFKVLNFIAFFRTCVDIDYSKAKSDIDTLFKYGEPTLIEYFLNHLFYNYFGKNNIIDIFRKSFQKMRNFCFTGKEAATEKYALKLKKLIFDTYADDDNFFVDINELGNLFEIFKFFFSEIEENYTELSEFLIYCIQYLNKHIKKDQENNMTKDKKAVKMKLSKTLTRLFFGNIIGRNLKGIFSDGNNPTFICQKFKLEKGSSLYNLMELYIGFVGELFERIACNHTYKYREPKKDEEDDQPMFAGQDEDEVHGNIKIALDFLNANIQELHSKFAIRFIEKFPHSNFNFKKNIITSMVYFHLNITPFKFDIELGPLMEFLNYLSQKKKYIEGEARYEILEYFKNNGKQMEKILAEVKIPKRRTKVIKISLDVRYLIRPMDYIKNYEKELRINFKHIMSLRHENIFRKCKSCCLILPNYFPKKDSTTEVFLNPFKNKVKRELYLHISSIILNPHFEKNVVTLPDLTKSVRSLEKALEATYSTNTQEYQQLLPLQEMIEEISLKYKNEEEKVRQFIGELHNHLRLKIRHVSKINENDKIVHDISDAMNLFTESLDSMESNLIECKGCLKMFGNSLDIIEDKGKVEAKLNHRIMNKKIFTNDHVFRYSPTEYPIILLKRNNILYSHSDMMYPDEEVTFEIKADLANNTFDLKFRHRKTKDILKSVFLHFSRFFHLFINSSVYKVIDFKDFAKFHYNSFKNLVNSKLTTEQY